MRRFRYRHAFSFPEIIVAFVIALVFFGGLLYFTTSTRTETSKAERYLWAMQIAQETIELAQSTPIEQLTQAGMQVFEGSLVDSQTRQSVKLPFNTTSAWQPQTKQYPEQYTKAYFFRRIKVEPVDAGIPNARFLTKVTVEVLWNENKVPDRIDSLSSDPDRMRKLSFSTVVFNEKAWY